MITAFESECSQPASQRADFIQHLLPAPSLPNTKTFFANGRAIAAAHDELTTEETYRFLAAH